MPGALANARQAAPQAAPATEEPDLNTPRINRGEMDLNTPDTPVNAMRGLQNRLRPGEGSVGGGQTEQEATPDEQAEYDRASQALTKVLYQDERTSAAVAQQLMPEDKIGSVAKASMMMISQLDTKFNFDETIIPNFTLEVVDRIIDMYENVHEDEFNEKEAQAAVGATWEGVMNAYGVEEEDYAELTAGMSDEEFTGYEGQYKEFLGEA